MIEITEKDDSVSWEEITDLLHRAYAVRKEQGLNYGAVSQTVEQTIQRAQPKGTIRNVTLVAKENGKLIGTTTFCIRAGNKWYEGGKTLFFHMTAVAPEQKGKGLGNRLIEETIAAAGREDCDTVVFDTAQKANDLVEWYTRRFGFQKVGLVSWPNTNYYSIEFVKYLKPHDAALLRKTHRAYIISSIKTRIGCRADGRKRLLPDLAVRAVKKVIKLLFYAISAVIGEVSRCVPYKRVLLFSGVPQMDEHIIDFYEIVKDTPRVRFYLLKRMRRSEQIVEYAKQNGITVLRKSRLVHGCFGRYFQVAVTPDGCFGRDSFPQIKQPTKIYINHGLHIVGRNDGKDTYVYSELYAAEQFDVICEPNKRIAEYIITTKPELKDTVQWVGWKYAEKEKQALAERERYREQLGYKKDDTVVFVVSTWGEHSLFHELGESLLQQIEKLSSEYKFILSAHPNEYRNKSGVGETIDAMQNERIRVRRVGEDWLPYMAAADVVISDYSTLTEVAITMGEKVILSDFPPETVWEQSAIAKIRPFLPIIKSGKQLKELLEQVKEAGEAQLDLKCEDDTYISRFDYEEKMIYIFQTALR